jgi:hypothetical protein
MLRPYFLSSVPLISEKNRWRITTEEKERLVSIEKQPGIPDTYLYIDSDNRLVILQKGKWYKI